MSRNSQTPPRRRRIGEAVEATKRRTANAAPALSSERSFRSVGVAVLVTVYLAVPLVTTSIPVLVAWWGAGVAGLLVGLPALAVRLAALLIVALKRWE